MRTFIFLLILFVFLAAIARVGAGDSSELLRRMEPAPLSQPACRPPAAHEPASGSAQEYGSVSAETGHVLAMARKACR